MKINFTKEHYNKMCELALKMLMTNSTISTKMGAPLNIVELIHTTSINTLNNIKAGLSTKIQNLENKDEWVEVNTTELDSLKEMKELVNLIVGFKRYHLELAESRRKKAELTEKLAELKESTKTPEDRIKEMEAELAAMDSTEEFN
jgi:hypothetical protein